MPTTDLYNLDISNFEKNQYLTQLKALREFMNKSEDLSNSEITFLTKNFSQLISIVPCWIENINTFSKPFERLVINQDVSNKNEQLKNLTNLRYPPLNLADKIPYNRASMKGTCIFYGGSMGMLPITIETRPKVGQMISCSKWNFNAKRDLKLVTICFSLKTALRNPVELMSNYKTFEECLKKMKTNNREVIIAVTEFIEDAFTRSVSPNNKKGYIMSALISDYFFNNQEEPVDAIYYPSVPNKGSAMNIAIKPESLDELFDMIEVSESIVFSDPSNGNGGWLSFGTAKCTTYDKDSLELEWIQSPIPLNDPINKIIERYDIKLP